MHYDADVTALLSFLRRWLGRLGALLLLAGLLAILALMRADPERITDGNATRLYVVDGDTLRVGARTVRIEGIDAVELHQLCQLGDGTPWPCGRQARDALQNLVARGSLVCTSDASDKFGRALSSCSVKGVSDLAAALVTQGWAVSGSGDVTGNYGIEEAEARAAARGIWRGRFERPADWRAAHPRSETDIHS